jgi:hypothetical protein
LFLRSGQAARQNATAMYEGQVKKWDPVTGDFEYDLEAKKSDKIVGYVSYFRLTNGYEHYLYMTVEQITDHARRYSASYKSGYGIWFDNPEPMRLKTPHKLNLMKWAPMTNDMQLALTIDQGVIRNPVQYTEGVEEIEINYPDGTESTEKTQPERATLDMDKMKAGDPEKHQGHPEPIKKVKPEPVETEVIPEPDPPLADTTETAPDPDFVSKREKLEADIEFAYNNGKVGTKNYKLILNQLNGATTIEDLDEAEKLFKSSNAVKK